MKKSFLFLCACGLFFLKSYAQPATDGYPIANFGLTVNVGADGNFFGDILQNTGKLGEWLQDKGGLQFYIEKNGKKHSFADFAEKNIERQFPFVHGSYAQSPLIQSTVKTEFFCPLAINDAKTSSLPVIMLEMTFKNKRHKTDKFEIIYTRPTEPVSASSNNQNIAIQICHDGTIMKSDKIFLHLKPQQTKTLRFAIAVYDSTWYSAQDFASAGEIAQYAQAHWDSLRQKTQDFYAHIPTTHDKDLDTYLRWYTVPAVSLTRITKKDEVLTMGYCELNQRDSYWTSWLHLVFYPELEKKMIEESIAWQQPAGKIPTTILPIIERHDDLDINAFFILRAWRYYDYYKDDQLLHTWFYALRKAMDWLMARDTHDDGLPAQVSFWGDWKDVPGIQGRLYSPFSAMTYLAALDKMTQVATLLRLDELAAQYKAAYQKGYDFLNKPVAEGGLWNGQYYCQRWQNGEVNTHLLQDQMIGVFYDVVPKERAESIVNTLNNNSLTEWGIAETTPYYPAEWGYEPATYHNGGVWPWLSFMDCWARLKMGREKEAIQLIKTVAKADLIDSGDFSPNEHINSLTGKNLGFLIQGWNAGLFGLVYFGLPQITR